MELAGSAGNLSKVLLWMPGCGNRWLARGARRRAPYCGDSELLRPAVGLLGSTRVAWSIRRSCQEVCRAVMGVTPCCRCCWGLSGANKKGSHKGYHPSFVEARKSCLKVELEETWTNEATFPQGNNTCKPSTNRQASGLQRVRRWATKSLFQFPRCFSG